MQESCLNFCGALVGGIEGQNRDKTSVLVIVLGFFDQICWGMIYFLHLISATRRVAALKIGN
jgi:heme/copper-type cytochrome/quinol oxidase subunit 4